MALAAITSHAAGLGKLAVSSALGQPLVAEIELVSLLPGEFEALTARSASPEAYAEAKVEYAAVLRQLNFKVERRADGKPVIRITSSAPINEPFVDLLVEMNWPAGRLVREYPILLDPPGFDSARVAPPVVRAPPPAPVQPPVVSIPAPPPVIVSTPVISSPPPQAVIESRVISSDAYGPVKSGDTLAAIAMQFKPDSVSLEQMLVALYRENEGAFIGKNMNRLRTGQILRVPSEGEVLGIERREAQKVVRVQVADWKAYRDRVAGAAPTVADSGSSGSGGKIAVAKPTAPEAATGSGDKLKIAKSDGVAGAPGGAGAKAPTLEQLNALREEAIAKDNQLKEANSRVKDLEKQIADMRKLMALKGAEPPVDAKAAAKVAEKPADKTAPAKPADAKTDTKVADAKAVAPPAAKTEPVKADAPKADAPKVDAAKVADAAKKDAPKPADAATAAPKAPDAPKVAEPAKPAATTAAPPPPKVATKTPPPPEPGLLDDPMVLAAGGGAGLLAIGGLAAFILRRKKAAAAKPKAKVGGGVASAIPSDLKPNTVTGASKGGLVDTGNSSFLTDFDKTGPGAIDTDEVDPVAEAEVYIAYGRDTQAEEILKEAMMRDKGRHEIQMKLLEIYHARKSAPAFETVAKELKANVGESSPVWAKAAAMGSSIDPTNPLYGGGSAENFAATGKFGAGAAGAAVAATAAAAAAPPDLDFDLGFTDTPAASSAAIDLSAPATGQDAPPAPMDFNIDVNSVAGAPSAVPTAGNLTTDSAPGAALDFDLAFNPSATLPATAAAATKAAAAIPEAPSFDFDLSALSLDTPAADDKTQALKVAAPAAASAAASGGETSTAVATKLELAKAYVEIGDGDGAKEILNEVAREGNAAQQAEAKSILAGL